MAKHLALVPTFAQQRNTAAWRHVNDCAPWRPAAALGGITLLLVLCGCSAVPTVSASSTATPAVAANMLLNTHRVTTVLTLNAPGGGIFTNRASCPAGTVLLSGGYSDPQSDPQQDSVLSSYPASLSSWAVQAIDVGGPLTLTIYIDCAQPNFPDIPKLVGTMVNNATSAQIQCPAGTTVSGGGFKGAVTSWTSDASGNGWKVVDGLASPSLTVFAVCQGGGHIVPGSLPSAAQTVPTFGQITASMACPSGQSLVGGGYTTNNGAAPFETYPTATLSSWMSSAKFIGAPPNGTVIAQAVCVKLV